MNYQNLIVQFISEVINNPLINMTQIALALFAEGARSPEEINIVIPELNQLNTASQSIAQRIVKTMLNINIAPDEMYFQSRKVLFMKRNEPVKIVYANVQNMKGE